MPRLELEVEPSPSCPGRRARAGAWGGGGPDPVVPYPADPCQSHDYNPHVRREVYLSHTHSHFYCFTDSIRGELLRM